ncbi:ATP-binding cassette domain-containing protein [Limnochorda pilosa]|uniref:Cobalt ABC transporter ATP-binding protein n=1 Tax=Limnochorda pilosa TaxID=1555112 RepID=A0A0K2SP12_LIMPI|nr:ATP-binding cassette domain-containing protein [Limnochorda pilosa]BAS28855.1 cobalt ABC transporter ATP-binding protein [Limnochorda pilosa]
MLPATGEPFLKAEGVHHAYPGPGGPIPSLRGVTLTVARGEWVAVAGPNGSGKSTLARILGGLTAWDAGQVWVGGEPLTPGRPPLRPRVGLVFQDPESQVVGSTVEEDVAFGPENLGLPPEEIERRVAAAVEAVGLAGLRRRPTRQLSGGQRQRLAVAGALAMEPDALVLDEPTSMLDPRGRREVLAAVLGLVRRRRLAVLWTTHLLDEALLAHRLLVLSRGRVVADGAPAALLASHGDLLEGWGLRAPALIRLAEGLRQAGVAVPEQASTVEAVAGAVARAWRSRLRGRVP